MFDSQTIRRMATSDLHALVGQLGLLRRPADDQDIIERIEALERLKAAASAAQAELASQLRGRRHGWPDASVGAEIALARHESPHAGSRHLDLAKALTTDLPMTYQALRAGDLTEARAEIIASETRSLTPEDRRLADLELASLTGLGDSALRERARTVVLRIDERAATNRRLQARQERYVTGRHLGDGTARVVAVIREEHFAAVIGALDTAAASARAAGDPRAQGQIKADTLVERVTGIDPAALATLKVNLVVGVDTLVGDDSSPGQLVASGGSTSPVPATLVRAMVARASRGGMATLRRLFVMPADGALVSMESRSRAFPRALAELIDLRDAGRCRTPFCNAPIRHHDHVVPHRDGGPTDADNGQGLCERCNYLKEAPGWTSWVDRGGEINTMTPAGHRHVSRPPPLAYAARRPRDGAKMTRAEFTLAELILAS